MASNVTCEPCISKTNKCQFDLEMPLEIDLLKNERNSLERSHPCFCLHYYACPWFAMFNVIFFNLFALEYVNSK
jgi:hypothetical protein